MVCGIRWIACILPLWAALLLGDMLGWFVFSVLRYRRQVALENLHHAFPEKSERQRRRIAARSCRHFMKTMVEFLRFPKLVGKPLTEYCEFGNDDRLLKRALVRGKGAILVSGHFGNWEILAAIIAQQGYPISSVYKPMKNRLIDKLIADHREMLGNRTIPLGEAARGILRTLRKNEFIAVLGDQNAGRMGIFIDFLGRPCSVHQGAALLALKTGAPIIYGYIVRGPRGRHRVKARWLSFDDLEGGATPENIRIVTEAHVRQLERAIRENPDQWLWMHRRWKRQPKPHPSSEENPEG